MAEGERRRQIADAVWVVGADLTHRAMLATDGQRRWRRMVEQAADPAAAQERLLTTILIANADTRFGREHGFRSLTARSRGDRQAKAERAPLAERYRHAVPAQTYESLFPYLDAQAHTGDAGLTTESPVLYARTGGTMGRPKDLPVTASTLKRLAITQRLHSFGLDSVSEAYRGRVLRLGPIGSEGGQPSGTSFGTADGLVHERTSRFLRPKFVVPPEIHGIEHPDTRAAVVAAMALGAKDLSCIDAMNPWNVVRLLDTVQARWDELLKAVADGDPTGLGPLSEDERELVLQCSRPRQSRARDLEQAAPGGDPLRSGLGRIWPRLAVLMTWTGGPGGSALDHVRPLLDERTRIFEHGYASTELRATIGQTEQDGRRPGNHDSGHRLSEADRDPRRPSRFGIPTFWDNFFEFVPVEDREAPHGEPSPDRFVSLADVEVGRQYYLVVTTRDGLYRYDTDDVVEVGPPFRATPTLAFVRRGGTTTSLQGERVNELQILDALEGSARHCGVDVGFFVVLAHTDRCVYEFMVEPAPGTPPIEAWELALDLDRSLARLNAAYWSERAAGRIGPIEVTPLRPGAGIGYLRAMTSSGRDSQFMHVHLQQAERFGFDFRSEGLTVR